MDERRWFAPSAQTRATAKYCPDEEIRSIVQACNWQSETACKAPRRFVAQGGVAKCRRVLSGTRRHLDRLQLHWSRERICRKGRKKKKKKKKRESTCTERASICAGKRPASFVMGEKSLIGAAPLDDHSRTNDGVASGRRWRMTDDSTNAHGTVRFGAENNSAVNFFGCSCQTADASRPWS